MTRLCRWITQAKKLDMTIEEARLTNILPCRVAIAMIQNGYLPEGISDHATADMVTLPPSVTAMDEPKPQTWRDRPPLL